MIYLCDLLVDMKIIFFFFALILFPKPAEYELIKHDFHLSKSKIKYRSESKTWEISAHIFIDDLQEAIKQKGVDISSMFDEYEEDSQHPCSLNRGCNGGQIPLSRPYCRQKEFILPVCGFARFLAAARTADSYLLPRVTLTIQSAELSKHPVFQQSH